MLTLAQAARLYQVPVIDYGETRGVGLLVSSGCGMMMAIMDAVPALRWCVDTDALHGDGVRIADFLLVAETVATPIGVCGWFSISDPAPLRAAIMALTQPVVVYGGNITFGVPGEARSLAEFTASLRANRALQTGSVDPVHAPEPSV